MPRRVEENFIGILVDFERDIVGEREARRRRC